MTMKARPVEKSPGVNLYEQVANRIQSLIKEGTLKPGSRIPSVRKMHQQMSVSITTVLEAYRLLEDRGLIVARPQSGYYVRHILSLPPAEPTSSAPPGLACNVDTSIAFKINKVLREPGMIKLGAAVPDPELFPLAALNRLMGQVMRQNPEVCHSYNALPGLEPLRDEVARRLMDAGCSLTPDQILIVNGTTEGMYLSLRAITKPGDTVAIESPSYYGLLEILQSLHLKALELPTHPRSGLSLPDLENALSQGQVAACAIVSNFSNPLGSCMEDSKKKALVEILERYDIPLVEDDVYGDLGFDEMRPKAIKAFDKKGLVLYCSSCSKTISPGLRVGWVVAGRYQNTVEQLKLFTNIVTAAANQLAIAAFLANGGYDRHLRHLRRAYGEQVLRMTQAICDYFPPETKVTRPTGGHVLWVELPPHFDAIALYQEAYQRQISIAPGTMFSASGNYQNCFRLNCGLLWSPKIDMAMKTLGELIANQDSDKTRLRPLFFA
ncbi:PLP-dependent aminotransferase family protein [Limnospira fusiformis SAG 85.79]|uniref:GntR family transcriptional regulatory protein n=3 Tax=Limnospira TaxID=2596745 RepID=A0A9P1KAN6_9CYAN|nr:GntR family transcriptional regulatory protein [Arthrospira platensis C1]QJB28468.1 PLP-dependent aminotransferase family protein [Limnospira fusiformis SAG 85.79]RAQ45186.1 PLP-dependent aminotransferase family protein [Arthrospira sp. O9.13F]CDM92785.1 GntR family transcriptional regulatory protein [Limnospira indica PCC 8005]